MKWVIAGAHLRAADVEPLAAAIPAGDLVLSGLVQGVEPKKADEYHRKALSYYREALKFGQNALVLEHFARTFWISPFRGMCDVVDGARRDASLRPNQIFAVSLPHSALTEDQQHAVVEVVRRELLTPVGLRTLARSDPGYKGRYTGPQERELPD